MDPFVPIAAQRRALADVLAGLTPEQWEARSLCEAWTVRELAGHVVVRATADSHFTPPGQDWRGPPLGCAAVARTQEN